MHHFIYKYFLVSLIVTVFVESIPARASTVNEIVEHIYDNNITYGESKVQYVKAEDEKSLLTSPINPQKR